MPPPPSYKLLWSPTFVMNQSTMTHPDGNRTGPEGAAQLAVDARYGLIAFDGAFQGCLSARGAYGSCTHAQNLSVIEEQSRHIKARNPHTKVFTYRNIELALSRDGPDCRKMYDERYAGFFLRRQDGHVLDEPSPAVNVSRLSECRAVDDNQSHYSQRDQYFIDWRNQSAVDWWLDEVVGSVARSHWVDGFFWDDTPANGGLGSEHKAILGNFSAAEIKSIDAGMLAAFTTAEHQLASAGKWALSYPDADDMNVAMPGPEKCVPVPCGHTRGGMQPSDCQACSRLWAEHYNCTCDRRPSTCLSRLREAASVASSGRPAMMTIPYPGTNDSVSCEGPAAVAMKGGRPLELSCVPGTGVMAIEFASFGRPQVQREGRFVQCSGPDCDVDGLVYWHDIQTNVAFAVRPSSKYFVGGETGCASCLRTKACTLTMVNASAMRQLHISERPFSCAVVRDCARFAVNRSCDSEGVMRFVKELCDGKQSCRVDPGEFSPPASCDGAGEQLWLAVKSRGCVQGAVVAGFREHLAAFLLARGLHAWMGHGWIASSPAVWFPDWDVDFGEPLGPLTIEGNVARRSWSNFDVALDCDTFTATFSKGGRVSSTLVR